MFTRTATPESTDLTELSRRLVRSDPVAFEQLFMQLRGRLVTFVFGIVRDSEASHDIVQDVFVYLWEQRSGIDPGKSLKAFLYRMARNRAYNLVRDRRSHATKEDDARTSAFFSPENPGIDAALDARLLGECLAGWIDALPDRQRDALRLSRFEGLSHDEIARVMDISPRTVNNHIVRALSTLDERIRHHQAAMPP